MLSDISIDSSEKLLGLLTAVAAALYSLWRYVVRPLVNYVKKVNHTTEAFSKAIPVLMDIAKEFSPNGGNSLRDVVNEIKKQTLYTIGIDRLIIDSLKYCYFECDAHGKYTYVSRRWLDLSGLRPEDAVGDGWINAIHPDDRKSAYEEWSNSVIDKRAYDHTYRVKNSTTGISTLLHGKSIVVKNKTGHILGYIGICEILNQE